MSNMAKIFVVVNLVLAVMCFGSAAVLLGAQDNYKEALQEATKQFDAYKQARDKERTNLEAQLAQQQSRASQAVADKTNAEETLANAQRDLAAAESANAALNTTVKTLTSELASLRQSLDTFRQANERMTDENKQATAAMVDAKNKWEKEVQNRVRLEQEVAQQQEQIATLTADKGDMQREIRQLRFWLDKAKGQGFKPEGLSEGQPGKVLSVRSGDFGTLVSISVGSEDGVRQGDVYHIRRGSTYVGMMKIDRVERNQAVGLFDNEFPGSGAPPRNGDTVYPG